MAPYVGGYKAALDMLAMEAIIWLVEILEKEEIESYKHAMSIWASKTAMADGEEAKKCMPQKPDCLCDIFGD